MIAVTSRKSPGSTWDAVNQARSPLLRYSHQWEPLRASLVRSFLSPCICSPSVTTKTTLKLLQPKTCAFCAHPAKPVSLDCPSHLTLSPLFHLHRDSSSSPALPKSRPCAVRTLSSSLAASLGTSLAQLPVLVSAKARRGELLDQGFTYDQNGHHPLQWAYSRVEKH